MASPEIEDRLDRETIVAHRYRILRFVGNRGFGQVYQAEDGATDASVSVMRLDREFSRPGVRDRFFDTRGSAQIEHRNAVDLTDYGEDLDGRLFLVMPWIEQAEALDELLAREHRLPWRRALAILEQVAEALAAAHARGILHGGLEPSRVLIDHEGNAHVLDFGLAPALESASITNANKPTPRITDTRVLAGKPAYMPPELVRGDPPNERTDIYALGVLIWELVSGSPPFTGLPVDVLHHHLHDPLPELVRGDAPVEIEACLRVALAKDPGERHAGVRELLEALRKLPAPSAAPQVLPRTKTEPLAPTSKPGAVKLAPAPALAKPPAAKPPAIAPVPKPAVAKTTTGPQPSVATKPTTGPQPSVATKPTTGPQVPVTAKIATGSHPSLAKTSTGPQPSVVAKTSTGPQPSVVAKTSTGPQPSVVAKTSTGPQPSIIVNPPTTPQPSVVEPSAITASVLTPLPEIAIGVPQGELEREPSEPLEVAGRRRFGLLERAIVGFLLFDLAVFAAWKLLRSEGEPSDAGEPTLAASRDAGASEPAAIVGGESERGERADADAAANEASDSPSPLATPKLASTGAGNPGGLPKQLGDADFRKTMVDARDVIIARCLDGQRMRRTLEVSISVAPSGKVEWASVLDAPGKTALGKCVSRQTRHVEFPPSVEGGKHVYSLRLR
ncbi:serine/threonine protein kinase [Nannocystaceae bacterium ST9]